nr:MAG TPA: hypothetical protein [Caudoviricetes sp.]
MLYVIYNVIYIYIYIMYIIVGLCVTVWRYCMDI